MREVAHVLVLFGVVSLSACSTDGDAWPVEVNALYRGFEGGTGTTPPEQRYFKFIDRRTVLNTVSADPPETVKTWFKRGEENVNSETYHLVDGDMIRIVYNLTSQYDGRPEGDKIFFTVTVPGGDPPTYPLNYVIVR